VAENIGVELAVELFLRNLVEGGELIDAGIVHQDVQLPECLLGLGEDVLHVAGFRDIALNGNCLTAVALDLGNDPVRAFLTGGVIHHNRCALGSQALCDTSTNSLRCPGHYRYFTLQFAHFSLPAGLENSIFRQLSN
jgi:hypothetical protein